MYDPETESYDALGATGFHVIQPKKGYRFSVDPFLLAAFASVEAGDRCLDLGTGSGVLPLLLSAREKNLTLMGVERQSEAVRRARRTMKANAVSDIQIIEGDVRQLTQHVAKGTFDCVVSNPPFRRAQQGRIPPDDERAAARFELAGGLEAFVAAAAWALRDGGTFTLIHLAERCVDVLTALRHAELEPKRIRSVHARNGLPAQMILVSACKAAKPGAELLAPLCIYREGTGDRRQYTEEVLAMYGMTST